MTMNFTRAASQVRFDDLGGVDAVALDAVQRTRPDAGEPEVADDLAGGVDAVLLELEDLLHRDHARLDVGDLGDAGDAPLAVRPAGELDDHVERPGDRLPDQRLRHLNATHADHRLDTRQRVARGVRVYGRHRPLMAGVHRLQHVQHLAAAALTDDDAVGTHTKRVLDEIARDHLALALDVRGTRLEAHDVALLQLQLRGVLDGEDALVL